MILSGYSFPPGREAKKPAAARAKPVAFLDLRPLPWYDKEEFSGAFSGHLFGKQGSNVSRKHFEKAVFQHSKNVLLLLVLFFVLLVPLAALAENTFGDCQTGESGEENAPAEEPVYQFITGEHIAYMNGSNDYMNPENNLTRAEAAKIIYTLLENPLAGEEGSSFADVPAGIWYEDYVNSMAAMELIEGYEGNVYKPDSFITRAEFVTILSRVYLPEEGTEDITFSDVPEGYWGYEALKNAVHRGWLEGYPDGSIKPENNITRTEAILVLNRMLDRSPDKNAINNAGKILQYLDVPYGYWAYYDIMEASVPHEHSENEDGSEVWTSFTPKTSDREPGYYLEDGQLYCVKEDGYYAKSEAIGVLDFNSSGQYTSGNADLD